MDDAQVFHRLVGQLLLRVPVLFRAQETVGEVVVNVLREGNLYVIEHRHGLEQADVLERAGNAGLHDLIGLLAVELLPAEIKCALRRHIHAGEQVEDRGLAGAVRPMRPMSSPSWISMLKSDTAFRPPNVMPRCSALSTTGLVSVMRRRLPSWPWPFSSRPDGRQTAAGRAKTRRCPECLWDGK